MSRIALVVMLVVMSSGCGQPVVTALGRQEVSRLGREVTRLEVEAARDREVIAVVTRQRDDLREEVTELAGRFRNGHTFAMPRWEQIPIEIPVVEGFDEMYGPDEDFVASFVTGFEEHSGLRPNANQRRYIEKFVAPRCRWLAAKIWANQKDPEKAKDKMACVPLYYRVEIATELAALN